jgi:hypothetical protein
LQKIAAEDFNEEKGGEGGQKRMDGTHPIGNTVENKENISNSIKTNDERPGILPTV